MNLNFWILVRDLTVLMLIFVEFPGKSPSLKLLNLWVFHGRRRDRDRNILDCPTRRNPSKNPKCQIQNRIESQLRITIYQLAQKSGFYGKNPTS